MYINSFMDDAYRKDGLKRRMETAEELKKIKDNQENQDKIDRITKLMNNHASTDGEKQSAKLLLEKLKKKIIL